MKNSKNLDFHELVCQPGYEWVRMYFEKNYQNKNFILEPILLKNSGPKKDGVYYLSGGDGIMHSYLFLNGTKVINRPKWYLFDRFNYPGVYHTYAIKITVI